MPKKTFNRPFDVVKQTVVNQSGRNGTKPVLIVVHSTEGHNRKGVEDLRSLGSWFNNPSAQASSHIGIDAEGNSARYVADDKKAWTCAGFNSKSLNIEHIGFTAQKFWPTPQYRKSAKYIAYWCRRHGIPLQKGKIGSDGAIIRQGVVRHSELGELGGNHADPGRGFNLRLVLRLARWYAKRGW